MGEGPSADGPERAHAMTAVLPTELDSDLRNAPPVERTLALDMVKHAIWAGPVLVAVGAAIWGWAGATSVAFGMALVLANLLISAVALGWAARTSMAMLLGVSLFGYLVRLGLITLAVLLVKDQSWVKLVPLGLTVIVTHLGLLFWELRYVSATLAFPGLRPNSKRSESLS